MRMKSTPIGLLALQCSGRRALTLTWALFVGAAGCHAQTTRSSEAPAFDAQGVRESTVRIDAGAYGPFESVWTISNPDAELVIAPQVGRVISYRLTGQENVLWSTVKLVKPLKTGDWTNWGGEKAWVWPQEAWKQVTGGAWPPTPGMEGPFEVKVLDNGLEMRTAEVPGFGVRVARRITLAASGSEVTTVTWLEDVSGAVAKVDVPIAAWTVMQVPVTPHVVARRAGAQSVEWGWMPMSSRLFRSIEPVEKDVLILQRPTDMSVKAGMDADLLAAVYDKHIVLMRDTTPTQVGVEPAERAHVYAQQDMPGWEIGAYIELEFTGPRQPRASLAQGTLTNVWEIRPVTPPQDGKRTGAWLAELVRGK